MADPSLRVLALVTDAFGGYGGIAQYNRDFLSTLARCDRIGDVIVLPRVAARLPDGMPSGVDSIVLSKAGSRILSPPLRKREHTGPFDGAGDLA